MPALIVVTVALAFLLTVACRRLAVASRQARKPAPLPPPPVAFCGCKHHLAYHDEATSQCYAQVQGEPKYRECPLPGGSLVQLVQVGFETNQCTCRRYVGPEPLPEVYAP